MKCLRCESVEMTVQTLGDDPIDLMEVDHCPECSGAWLDSKELKTLDDNFFVDMEEITYKDSAPTEDDAAINCPRCEGAPQLRKCHPAGHEQVVVDQCPECHGFWLDKGEMEKIREVSDKLLIASLLDDD